MSCEGCPSKGTCTKDASLCTLQSNPDSHIKYVVAVLSGKGGVGKSTVTTMLARALQRLGYSAGILDADITGPSIPRLLNAEDERAYSDGKQYVYPVVVDGIKMMSLNAMLDDENDPVVWRGPIVNNVLKQFYSDVLWGDLDVLLIDMPPGTGDTALTILQEFPVSGVVMVAVPQPMIDMIVTKAIRMCEKIGVPVLGIVENMAYLDCPHCSERTNFYEPAELENFVAKTNTRLYQTLPMLDLLRNVSQYDAYTLAQQEKVNELFEQFAKDLMEDLEADKEKKA